MPINAADTAWVLISAAMVMLMTPGVAFFYGGMVRRKNFLSTLMMSLVTLGLIGLLWVLYGYSLSFGPDKYGINGGLNFIGLIGVGQDPSKGASQIIGANKEEEIIAYVIGTIFLL